MIVHARMTTHLSLVLAVPDGEPTSVEAAVCGQPKYKRAIHICAVDMPWKMCFFGEWPVARDEALQSRERAHATSCVRVHRVIPPNEDVVTVLQKRRTHARKLVALAQVD
eukprot:CAMPEP_0183345678 /NCGR_PEP_ID=MMETSP0164_2-20130417/11035_1 /TAXON_ID=221442 /ORGANISM="Coccolithus pelagicus ssp braarudi, Strain PLY182g" /LENGTH=109 /DNA_ID=CAMNT_0025516849 /DNA_START=37 /DNA_END=366 /DNA_ORIENTATION=-